jgi:hypothetical protein
VFFTGDRQQNASKILYLNRQNAKPEILKQIEKELIFWRFSSRQI